MNVYVPVEYNDFTPMIASIEPAAGSFIEGAIRTFKYYRIMVMPAVLSNIKLNLVIRARSTSFSIAQSKQENIGLLIKQETQGMEIVKFRVQRTYIFLIY